MSKILNVVLHNKKANLVLIISILFLCFSSYFPIGSFHSSTLIENTSEYIADITKNNTVNGTYAAMMVEPKDNSDKKINNPYTEFYNLYGVFKERLATYIGSANADKNHSIKLKEIDEDINFSFLSVDSGFGVQEYYKDEKGNMVYKTEYYPLELMFYSNHPGVVGQFSFLYISQSRANSLLDKAGLEHNRENYYNLLNTLITLDFDGVEYKFAIDNIYFERNYFYNAVEEVIGEFFLAGARYPEGIKRQGVFFLRNYPYQNKYFINYATSLYSQNDFDYRILELNFKDGFKIDQGKLVYFANTTSDFFAIILVFFIVSLLVCCAALIIFGSYEFVFLNHLCILVSLFLPYFAFWIFHLFGSSILFFSNFATNCYIWSSLVFFIVYLITWLIKGKHHRKNLHEGIDNKTTK